MPRDTSTNTTSTPYMPAGLPLPRADGTRTQRGDRAHPRVGAQRWTAARRLPMFGLHP